MPRKKYKVRRDFCRKCLNWKVIPGDEESCIFKDVLGRGRCSAERPAEYLWYESWPITKPDDLGCEFYNT